MAARPSGNNGFGSGRQRPPVHSNLATIGRPVTSTRQPSGGAAAPGRDSIFASLSNRNFRWFVFGQAASTSGLWTQRVAQDWLVLQLTHNAFFVGLATAMQFLPTL